MSAKTTPVVGFAGWSDSGKTTLAARVVELLGRRGLRVAVVKHDAHGHYREAAGSDSSRYREAGAAAVVVASPGGTVRFDRTDKEKTLAEIAEELHGFDLIVAEGFKREPHPKIVVCRSGDLLSAVHAASPPVIAVAAPRSCGTAVRVDAERTLPVLDIDRPEAVANFLADRFFE
jgi:molybdopterin-guanine dinucleotide biosynthesis protein B